MCSIEPCQFMWPWVTHNLDFKVTISTLQTHSFITDVNQPLYTAVQVQHNRTTYKVHLLIWLSTGQSVRNTATPCLSVIRSFGSVRDGQIPIAIDMYIAIWTIFAIRSAPQRSQPVRLCKLSVVVAVVVVVMIICFISIRQVAAVFTEQENETISIKDVKEFSIYIQSYISIYIAVNVGPKWNNSRLHYLYNLHGIRTNVQLQSERHELFLLPATSSHHTKWPIMCWWGR